MNKVIFKRLKYIKSLFNDIKQEKDLNKYECICEKIHNDQIKNPDKLITGYCHKHKTDWF